jgi:Tfp pilus assembly protein PilX
MKNRRGSVLVLSVVIMLLIFSLATSLLAVAGARCNALARDSRRAQALALAESAIADLQAKLNMGKFTPLVKGELSTGSYSATAERSSEGRVSVMAVGKARPLIDRAVEVKIKATLTRKAGHWYMTDWEEMMP